MAPPATETTRIRRMASQTERLEAIRAILIEFATAHGAPARFMPPANAYDRLRAPQWPTRNTMYFLTNIWNWRDLGAQCGLSELPTGTGASWIRADWERRHPGQQYDEQNRLPPPAYDEEIARSAAATLEQERTGARYLHGYAEETREDIWKYSTSDGGVDVVRTITTITAIR